MRNLVDAPLVPSDIDLRMSVPHAAFATLTARLRGGSPEEWCGKLYPHDKAAKALFTKAVMTGGTTTATGWMAEVVGSTVAAFIGALSPPSAGAELIRRGLVLSLEGHGAITVPDRVGAPPATVFVAEGAPIPVGQIALGSATLRAKKMGVIIQWTRELSRLSSADVVFTALMREQSSLALDAAMLSTAAGDATTHQGLLYNVTPLTGTASPVSDLMALAEAVAPASPSSLVYIASPGRAAAVSIRADVDVTILPSLAVGATDVVAVDIDGLVHGLSGEPDLTASTDTTLHLSDTPAEIGVVATPNVVAAPTQSLFQTATLALRLLIDVAWAKRRPGCVQVISGVQWP
jgi:hypothetical protein